MFESRHRSSGSSANRWLIVAGAGLVILAFVARMLLDIGHTRVSDLAGVLRPDTASAAAPVPVPVATPAPLDTVVVATLTPPAPSPETTATSPAVVPPQAAPPRPTGSGSRYVIQIGAFGSEANAARLGQRASGLGYDASVIPQARAGTTLYLVRVTVAGSAAEARVASDSLAKALGVKAVVLRPGQ
jgi:cell division septation protein DedD